MARCAPGEEISALSQKELEGLLHAMPGMVAVLRPDPPVFTVLALSDGYVEATGLRREDAVGRGFFDCLGVASEEGGDGVERLRSSMRRALASGLEDSVPLQRYRLRHDGETTRYWSVVHRPVGGAEGIRHLLQRVEDLTGYVIPGEAAGPVDVARLAAKLREVESRLGAELDVSRDLHQLASRLVRVEDPREALGEVLDAAVAATRADFGSLRLVDAATGNLELVAHRNLPDELVETRRNFRPLPGTVPASALEGRTVEIEDVETSEEFAPYREMMRGAGIRAALVAPLCDRNQKIEGIVAVHYREPRRRSPEILQRFELFARQAAELVRRIRVRAALEESERRFALMVQSVRDHAMLQLGPDGEIVSWNLGAERLFGYGESEIVGQSAAKLLPLEATSAGELDSRMAALRGGDTSEQARWLRRKDGTLFWSRGVTEPIRDARGELRGFTVLLRDETERRRQEERLASSLAEKDALVEEVHHRVKNNLQIVVSLLNLQARELDDPRTLTLFEQARDRISSIAALHDQLYRGSDGETIERVDLAAYAERLLLDRIRSHHLDGRVAGRVRAEQPVTLGLDRGAPWALVLNELVTNALVHAYPRGLGGPLEVSLEVEDDDCVMEVRDHGEGLPIEGDRRRGLGLDLVRILVGRLAGSFELVAADGGAVAHVRFPLEESEE